MAIPEHVKRQAMNAVSHSETMRHVRLLESTGPDFTYREDLLPEPEPFQPISDDVKRQAMNAVMHRETTAHIHQLEMTDSVAPMHTPSFHSQKIAERIADMHREGMDPALIHQTMSKDNFGREL